MSDSNPTSPHGHDAELADEWVAERWAPHGDLNVPAVSYADGEANPAAREQERGVKGDSVKAIKAVAKREV